MIKKTFLLIIIFPFVGWGQTIRNINPDPFGEPWIVGGFRELSEAEISKIPELVLPENTERASLPSRINNAKLPYFRSIVLQADGSCSQNSGVAYVFTYEINYLRGVPSTDSVNLYPSHYTYNFLNGGSGKNGSNYTDGWQIIKENGVPNLKTYGGLNPLGDNGWMSGYDKYESGMGNRVSDYYRIKIGTPQGLETLKRWMYDHGNGSSAGGLACFSAGIANAITRPIPLGQYEQKKRIITAWSDPVDHAMTFVGYDDSVRFDFNNDKKYTNDIDITGDSIVDMRDWEIGALILANSWGLSWGDSGFAYCPYRLLALKVSEGGISGNQAYVVIPKASHQPQMTLRLKMNHNKRSQLTIRAGVAEYIHAQKPDFQLSFTALAEKGGALPLQNANNDTIEFGLDISPLLTQKFCEPVVFFLQIIEDDGDTSGFGNLLSWSVKDLRGGEKYYYSSDSNVELVNNGTTVSKIIINPYGWPPENLKLANDSGKVLLSWEKPLTHSGLQYYVVYRDGKEFRNTTDTFLILPYDVNGTTFKVKASYPGGLSSPSNTVVLNNDLHLPVAGSGYSLMFDGIDDCVDCGKKVHIADHDFTVEFWAKREPDAANRFVVGHGKWNTGSKGLHIGFRGNRLYFGFWGDDIQSDETFTDNGWHHYACTYDTVTKLQKLYRDGVFLNERVAKGNYRGEGSLYIGCMSATRWIFNGELDEVRIWNYARTEKEIAENRYMRLKGNESGLLGYWHFDERSGDSLFDFSANNNTGVLKNMQPLAWKSSDAWNIRILKEITDTIMIFSGYSKYGHPVSITITEHPQNGSVLLDTASGFFYYSAGKNYSGSDSFTYSVADDSLTSFNKILIFTPISSIEQMAESLTSLQVYPNPFDNYLLIQPSENEGLTQIMLFDVQGRKMMEFKAEPKRMLSVNTTMLENGIYLMMIKSGRECRMIKLIKK